MLFLSAAELLSSTEPVISLKLVMKFIYEISPASDLDNISQVITSVLVNEDTQGDLNWVELQKSASIVNQDINKLLLKFSESKINK